MIAIITLVDVVFEVIIPHGPPLFMSLSFLAIACSSIFTHCKVIIRLLYRRCKFLFNPVLYLCYSLHFYFLFIPDDAYSDNIFILNGSGLS